MGPPSSAAPTKYTEATVSTKETMLGAAPCQGEGSPAARTSSQYSRVEYSGEYSGARVEG
jgi:hypothetical protein